MIFQEQIQQETVFFFFIIIIIVFNTKCLAIPEPTCCGALLLIIYVSYKHYAGKTISSAGICPALVNVEAEFKINSALSKVFCLVCT